MSVVILSPHIDDAVFSCWHLLSQPEAVVVTFFCGIPKAGTKTLWDRVCGEPDSVAMMHRRLQENENVLNSVNVQFANLDYLDGQYRPGERNISEMADRILAQVKNKSVFFAPVAAGRLWRHPDHITVREVAKELLSRGQEVSFYADIPYMQMPFFSTKVYIKHMNQRTSKLLKAHVGAEITELATGDQIIKLQAMQKFESQYKMTNLTSAGMLGRKANTRFEVIFNMTNSKSCSYLCT